MNISILLSKQILNNIIMAITKVWIEDGCIACNACEEIVDDVFEVDDECTVKVDANLIEHDALIREAADACPVEVIIIEE